MTVHSGDEATIIVQHLLCSAEINLQLCRALTVLPTFQQLPLPQALCFPRNPVFLGQRVGIKDIENKMASLLL